MIVMIRVVKMLMWSCIYVDYVDDHHVDGDGDDEGEDDDGDEKMMMVMMTMVMIMTTKVNTMAVMEATEVVMERMSGKGGLIVNTASLAGASSIIHLIRMNLSIIVNTAFLTGGPIYKEKHYSPNS